MWIYQQSTGKLFKADGAVEVATGYSGFGKAKNDPSSQGLPGLGPIPRGVYLLGSLSENDDHGPLAIHLVPETGTNTLGRSGFLVHGDSKEAAGSASHGCIIMPRAVREAMIDSHDKQLVVIDKIAGIT
jgi:hypothetical protein